MSKITDFETPMGAKGNILRPSTWIPLILGSLVLLATFSAAERVGKTVSGRIPLLNTTPAYPFQTPAAAPPVNQMQYLD